MLEKALLVVWGDLCNSTIFKGNNIEVVVKSFRCAVESQTKGSIMDVNEEEYQNWKGQCQLSEKEQVWCEQITY